MKAYYVSKSPEPEGWRFFVTELPSGKIINGPHISADIAWQLARAAAHKTGHCEYTALPDDLAALLPLEEREKGPRACWLVRDA